MTVIQLFDVSIVVNNVAKDSFLGIFTERCTSKSSCEEEKSNGFSFTFPSKLIFMPALKVNSFSGLPDQHQPCEPDSCPIFLGLTAVQNLIRSYTVPHLKD